MCGDGGGGPAEPRVSLLRSVAAEVGCDECLRSMQSAQAVRVEPEPERPLDESRQAMQLTISRSFELPQLKRNTHTHASTKKQTMLQIVADREGAEARTTGGQYPVVHVLGPCLQ